MRSGFMARGVDCDSERAGFAGVTLGADVDTILSPLFLNLLIKWIAKLGLQ